MSQQINLLNPTLRPPRDWLTATPLAIACCAWLLLIAAGYAFVTLRTDRIAREAAVQTAQMQALQTNLLALAKTVSARKPSAQLAADLAGVREQLRGRQAIMAILDRGALGNTRGFADYLRGFARQVPSGLWLTGFTIGAGGSEMEIRGRMLDPATLPEYIRRLNSEPVFQGRSFAALNIRRPEGNSAAKGAAVSSVGSPAAPSSYVDFILTQSAPAKDSAAVAEKMP